MKGKFKAMVLSCMDPRFQPLVFNFLKKKKLNGKYSAFTIAGAAVGITDIKFKKWQSTFLENLSTSIKLHGIKKLIVINHYDCGAVKIVSRKKILNNMDEAIIHKKSFKKLQKIIKIKFRSLKTEFYIMSLNGKIDKPRI